MVNKRRVKWLIERYTPKNYADIDVKDYLRRELGFQVTEDIIVTFFSHVNDTPEVVPELLDCDYPRFMEYLLFFIHTEYPSAKDENVFISRILDFIVDDIPNNYEDDVYEVEFLELYYLDGNVLKTLSTFVQYFGNIHRSFEYFGKFVNQHEMDLFRKAAEELKKSDLG